MRRCSCGETTQPPIHLLRDRLDVFDSNDQPPVPVVGCRFSRPIHGTGVSGLIGGDGGQELKPSGAGQADRSNGQERVDSAASDDNESISLDDNESISLDDNKSISLDDNESISLDLRWLFGEDCEESLSEGAGAALWTEGRGDVVAQVSSPASTSVLVGGERPDQENKPALGVGGEAGRGSSGVEHAVTVQSSSGRDAGTGGPPMQTGVSPSRRSVRRERRRGGHGYLLTTTGRDRLGGRSWKPQPPDYGHGYLRTTGWDSSRFPWEADRPQPPDGGQEGGGRQRKLPALSPVDREREKREREVRDPLYISGRGWGCQLDLSHYEYE